MDKITEINMDYTTFSKIKGKLNPQDKKDITITSDKPISSSSSSSMSMASAMEESEILEPEAVIAPQDKATMKYLSNVKDVKTGQISKPFTIGAQRYQMVRALSGDNKIVMAVFAHDETDDNGDNVIYTVEDFERDIALPMKEAMGMVGKDIQVAEEDTYEGYKHYLVNKKTNKIRKFKTVEEILSANKTVDEDYMGGKEFRKYMTEKLFGRRKRMNELGAEPIGGAEDMTKKAERLMDIIDDNSKVQNAIKTIKTPDAKKEVIAAFAELIGVPRNGLTNLVSQIKDMSKEPVVQPTNEKVIITKNQLIESLKPSKVIKTIKIKDIK
jgi:uncharacterized protein YukJ